MQQVPKFKHAIRRFFSFPSAWWRMNNFIRACNRLLSLAPSSDKCTNNTRRAPLLPLTRLLIWAFWIYVQLHLSDKVLLQSELKFGRFLLLLTCGWLCTNIHARAKMCPERVNIWFALLWDSTLVKVCRTPTGSTEGTHKSFATKRGSEEIGIFIPRA